MSVTTKLPVLASAGLLLVLGASCTQPRMNCTTSHSNYAAKYTLKSGDPSSPCGSLPGDLHKLWRARHPKQYHLEYGYSCMGYEIAGGLGVKMAQPEREVFVMVGDGSYMMLNSELQTSVMLGKKLIVTVLDNRGFGCINRLQAACGGAAFSKHLPLERIFRDVRSFRIYDADGKLLGRVGSYGIGLGQFDATSGLALDGDGHIYVTDWAGNRFQKFELDYGEIEALATATTTTRDRS